MLKGVYVDYILELGPKLRGSPQGVALSDLIDWERQTRQLARMLQKDEDLHAYTRTLVAGSRIAATRKERPLH